MPEIHPPEESPPPDDPFVVVTTDPAGTVTTWNPGAETVCGWSAAEAVGQPLAIIFTDEDRAAGVPEREMATAFREGEAIDERWHRREDGTTFWGSGVMSALRAAGGELLGFVKVFRDLTGQRADAEALRASAERAAFRAALVDALRPISGADELKAAATRLLGRHLGASRVHYGEVDDEAFVIVDEDYTDGSASLTGRFRMEDFNPALKQAHAGGLVVVTPDVANSVEVLEADRTAYAAVGVAAQIAVPLVRGGALVAVLAVHQNSPREWTASEALLVEETAERTWVAVNRARAEAALRESEERYRTLFTSVDQGFFLADVVLGEAGEPVDIAYVEANPAATQMMGQDYVGRRLSEIDPGFEPYWFEAFGRVARTGQSERAEHYAAPLGAWFEFHLFKPEGASECRIAVVFTDVTERKQAEEVLRVETNRATFRTALADALRPLGDPDDIQAEAARLLGEHLGASRAFYAVVDPDTERVTISREYASGVPGASTVGTYVLSDYGSNVAAEYRAGRTRSSDDTGSDPRLAASGQAAYTAIGVGAYVGVPLVKGDRLVGLLGVNQATPRAWTAAEIALVEETAERTWAAVERAQAEAEVRALNATLECRVAERTAEVRALAARLTLAEQAERERIAYVLHDDLQQQHHGLALMLSLLTGPLDPNKAADLSVRASAILDEIVQTTRTLVSEMNPTVLQADRLVDLLEWIAAETTTGLDVHVEVSGDIRVVDPALRIVLFQSVREALFNVAKHAGVSAARLVASESSGEVSVRIEDAGAGFDMAAVPDVQSGLGLFSVRERLGHVGGRFAIDSAPGRGTRVMLAVPSSSSFPDFPDP